MILQSNYRIKQPQAIPPSIASSLAFGSTKKIIQKIYKKSVTDKIHAKQVEKYATNIFDCLTQSKSERTPFIKSLEKRLHKIDDIISPTPTRRKILQDAAKLHDCGKSTRPGIFHHLESFKIISEYAKKLKNKKDKDSLNTSAVVAKYHKGLINKRKLKKPTLELIGILKLADSLAKAKEGSKIRFKDNKVIISSTETIPKSVQRKINYATQLINKHSKSNLNIKYKTKKST